MFFMCLEVLRTETLVKKEVYLLHHKNNVVDREGQQETLETEDVYTLNGDKLVSFHLHCDRKEAEVRNNNKKEFG